MFVFRQLRSRSSQSTSSRSTFAGRRVGLAAVVGAAAVLCALFASATAPLALAKQPIAHPGVAIIPRTALDDAPALANGMRLSARTGAPIAIYGPGDGLTPAAPETMARQYLARHRQLLRLRQPDLADLVLRRTHTGPAGVTVRFDQQVEGIPVDRGEIAITIDRRNRVVFVASSYEPDVQLPATEPAIAAAAARAIAVRHLGLTGEVDLDRTTLVAYRTTAAGWRLAYRVNLVPRVAPTGDWEVMVDAANGEVLAAVDKAFYVDGNGNIFDADPLSSAGASYGDPGFSDNNDANSPELEAELVNVTLPDIDLTGGTYTLKGPWAEIRDFESPFKGLFQQSTSSWNNNRFDDAFEAANTYRHIDNIMRWLNVTLGLNVVPYQYAGGVRFDPHGLSGADNSHYISGTGQLAFGEGGVDDAEDSDVVIHELGHGIHDWATGGSLSQVDGLSEGFGDYMASSYSRSLGQWQPSDPQYFWVFDWDGHNPFWGGRVTNWSAHYPDGLTGSIHTDGQIWATCLMRIWNDIGREKTDKACIAGLAMTNSSSSQNDAANAMLQAALAMSYTQAEISAIVSNFQQTGYTVGSPADIQLTPLQFTFSLPPNTTATEPLLIENLADPSLGADLIWGIIDREVSPLVGGGSARALRAAPQLADRAARSVRAVRLPDIALAKGAVDPRAGAAPVRGSGGPDGYGYLWIDSNEPGGPTFAWQDITGLGTAIALSDDDFAQLPLPFVFPFYGGAKTSVKISSNGYLTFGGDGTDYTNDPIPNATDPNDLIAPFWDDLNPSLGGTIHYYYDAPQDRFIVQYTGIQHYGGSSPYTFECMLGADGSLLYQYLSMQGGLTSATVGIENADASIGLQVVYNAAYVQDNLAVSILPPAECPWLSANPNSGTVPPQGSQTVDVTADATGLVTGNYACELLVSSNDPDESTVQIPVSLEVTGSTGVDGGGAAVPVQFRLHANRPNPFNPSTAIRYELPAAAVVRLAVYDAAGHLVRALVDAAAQEAGAYTVRWDGRDAGGQDAASGVYFYRLEAGTFSETQRAVLVR